MWRQGDLLIEKAEKIEGKLQKDNIVALGEMTGHSHKLEKGKVYKAKKGEKFLDLSKKSKVVHQEHKALSLKKGKYKVTRQKQYKPKKKKAVRVQD